MKTTNTVYTCEGLNLKHLQQCQLDATCTTYPTQAPKGCLHDRNSGCNPHDDSQKHPLLCSGPAGLFAALELAQAGLPVVVLERGQPVESRGRDIGALIVRRILNTESNLCYGQPLFLLCKGLSGPDY